MDTALHKLLYSCTGRAYDTHSKHALVLWNNAIRVIASVPPVTNVNSLALGNFNKILDM